MRNNRVFWDASAIVPLCVHQDTSMRARQTLRKHSDLVVWWATLAEARSAFARAVRDGRAGANEHARALRRLDGLSNAWREVDPDNALRARALQLLDDHPLRTGDAFQLAAALAWCKENPRRRIFVCCDDRLADVAEKVGFNVIRA
jgi:predicted nucleic acid-binding protein